ncbi:MULTISPECIES: hypothetical protein [Microbacterium]|uniref:hypothetical protein n=1 Tax=Microbacterium TaxID=33882 RepID=UPI00146CA433|nr:MULTISPECIES: hypothetical protein [Microbacterium]
MKRRTAIGLAIAAAVAIVTAVTIALVAWGPAGGPDSPEGTARAYLDALAAGDGEAVDALRAEPLDALTAEAFAGASAYLTDPRVARASAQGESAAVQAEAEIAGERVDLRLTLESTDEGWRVVDGDLGSVRATTVLAGTPVGDAVWIGDALAPSASKVALLPAEYEVAAAPRGILTGSETIGVGPGAAVTVELDAALSPDAASIAQTQLDVYLDACAEPAPEVPDHCGLRVPWAADLTSLERIAFRIDERPVLALSADASTFDATGGVIVATATGAARAGGDGTFTYRADDWAVRGSVEFTGDEMVLSVR